MRNICYICRTVKISFSSYYVIDVNIDSGKPTQKSLYSEKSGGRIIAIYMACHRVLKTRYIAQFPVEIYEAVINTMLGKKRTTQMKTLPHIVLFIPCSHENTEFNAL